MPHLLRACALVFLVCAACDAGEPRVGSPGLEPPRDTHDGGLGEDSDPGLPAAGRAGSGGPTAGAGTTGSSGTPPGAGMSGGAGAASSAGAGGTATGAGGAGGAIDPMSSGDGGVNADAGAVPFSELHQAEIMKDCNETVFCLVQRDEQLEPDPFNACLEDSAALLDENPQLQERFLTIFQRCSAFVVCDYYDCAIAPP